MSYIIGLGHTKGVGKDTFAKMLEEQFEKRGIYARRMAFADPVYEVAYNLFSWAGMKDKAYYDANPAEKGVMLPIGKTPREILIGIGNGLRDISPDVWIELLLARVEKCADDVVIITDVRYPNEFMQITKRDGVLLHVTRENAPKTSDPADDALLGFEDKWDYVVKNDGSLEELQELAKSYALQTMLPS